MILTCPNCDSKFRVKEGAIGANGRKVKCSNCAHIWHAMPDGSEALAFPPDTAPIPTPDPAPLPDSPELNEGEGSAIPAESEPDNNLPPMDDSMPEEEEVPELPPLPPEQGFKARKKPVRKKKKSPVVAWVVLILLLAATAGGGFFFQKDIIILYPPIGKIYSLLGQNPDLAGYGLELKEVKAEFTGREDDLPVLVITGEIHTSLFMRTDIPVLRGALVDSDKNELFMWEFEAEKPDILPSEIVNFTVEVEDPPPGAVEIDLKFKSLYLNDASRDAMKEEHDEEGEEMPAKEGE